MALSDELGRLGELHQGGVLTDDEFARAKARVLDEAGRAAARPLPAAAALNGLRRSRGDRWLGGVCGGLAQMSGLSGWAWRLLFALLMLCAGTGVLIYGLLWIFVPADEAPHDPRHAAAG